MFGLGIPELIVVFILLLLVVLSFWLPRYLKKKQPGKIWIGLLLSFILPPFGQLYVDGSAIWIIALFFGHVIFKSVSGNLAIAWLLTSVLSSMIMYYRLLKSSVPKSIN